MRVEEEVAELRGVEADDEAAKGLEAPALTARERGEPPRGETVPRQCPIELDGSLDARIHADRDAGREHRIEKRARIPPGPPPVSGVRGHAAPETLPHATTPLPPPPCRHL